MVPGNHEVDINKNSKSNGKKGLVVDSLEEINDYVSHMNEAYLTRLDYFYEWVKKIFL